MKEVVLTICVSLISLSSMSQQDILLKNHDPIPIHKTQSTFIKKAKYPVVDFHTHPYPKSPIQIERWIRDMKEHGIKKSIVLTYSTGKAFDSIYNVYSKYGDIFELWCGIDYTGYNQKGWSDRAVKELERCHRIGAKGVGELGDKGLGLFYSKPTKAHGMHIDDSRIKPVIQKCGDLGMPINIHVAEPYWMYLPSDNRNDGLMNALTWKIDTSKDGLLSHEQLIATLENAVRENPGTTFIACHFANCSYDLSILGRLLETYDNLYADISARYAETAVVPRYTKKFYEKYQNKLLYGTDMGMKPEMYKTTFRILETEDEHFYNKELFSYHWSLHGLGLDDQVLRKLYNGNAEKILKF